jgi:hypothetical protein
MRGDSNLYGNTHTTVLESDWTSGTTFTVHGSGAQGWLNGQVVTVEMNDGENYGISRIRLYHVGSVQANGSNTNVTITEAAPGLSFYAGGIVNNVSRNVKVYRMTTTDPDLYYVPNTSPRIVDNHNTDNEVVNWEDVTFISIYYYRWGGTNRSDALKASFTFTNTVLRNCVYSLNYTCATYTNVIAYSCNRGWSAADGDFDGCQAYANTEGISNGTSLGSISNCKVYSNASVGLGYVYVPVSTTDIFANGTSSVLGYGMYGCAYGPVSGCNFYDNGKDLYMCNSMSLLDCDFTAHVYDSIDYSNFILASGCTFHDAFNVAYSSYGCLFEDCEMYNVDHLSLYSSDIYVKNSVLHSMDSEESCMTWICDGVYFEECTIGWNGETPAPNIMDVYYTTGKMTSCTLPSGGLVFGDNVANYVELAPGEHNAFITSDCNDQPGDWRSYQTYGMVTKVANPSGSNFESNDGYCQEIVTYSNITQDHYVQFIGDDVGGDNQYGTVIVLPGRECTVKVKMMISSWEIMPTSGEMYLELRYFDDSTTAMAVARSTNVFTENDSTVTFTISVTPSREDKAYIRGIITAYDSLGTLYCDTAIKID